MIYWDDPIADVVSGEPTASFMAKGSFARERVIRRQRKSSRMTFPGETIGHTSAVVHGTPSQARDNRSIRPRSVLLKKWIRSYTRPVAAPPPDAHSWGSEASPWLVMQAAAASKTPSLAGLEQGSRNGTADAKDAYAGLLSWRNHASTYDDVRAREQGNMQVLAEPSLSWQVARNGLIVRSQDGQLWEICEVAQVGESEQQVPEADATGSSVDPRSEGVASHRVLDAIEAGEVAIATAPGDALGAAFAAPAVIASGMPGPRVSAVVRKSIAEKAGLRVGDVLVSVNGGRVHGGDAAAVARVRRQAGGEAARRVWLFRRTWLDSRGERSQGYIRLSQGKRGLDCSTAKPQKIAGNAHENNHLY